jgi:cytochrome c-type biogenesis protein CcmF
MGANGQPGWLVRVFWNPWARMIFLGPLLMALGGGISLSDRRLRIGLPRRAAGPVGATALEPAE